MKHRLFAIFAGLFLLSVLGSAIVKPATVHAAVTGTFVDGATIRVGGKDFIDQNPFDTKDEYIYQHDGCTDKFQINNGDFEKGSSKGTNSLVATIRYEKSFNSKCVEDRTDTITFQNLNDRFVNAYLLPDGRIWMPQAQDHKNGLTEGSDPKAKGHAYYKKNQPGDTIWLLQNSDGGLNPYGNGGSRVWKYDSSNGHAQYDIQDGSSLCLGGCTTSYQVVLRSGYPNATIYPDGPNAEDPNAGLGGGGGGPDQPTCESTGRSLGWIMCPIINGVADGVNFIYEKLLFPLLTIKPISISSTNNPLYSAWSSFRIVANVLLVLFLIVVVFAQTIGGGMIDAYAARKIIPRLMVAAILINLSIYIVAFGVDIMNIVGKGIAQLIYMPFNASGSFNFSVGSLTSIVSVGAILGASGTIWALIAAGGGGAIMGFVLLFVVLPLVIAFIGAFLTLFLRQALIVFLVLISPIAFALYCLPNTEQYFKKWWDIFIKTLLVYPIVMVIFAFATIAPVIFEMTGRDDLLTELIQIIALFLPLFLIPFAFKMAGGIMGSFYGAVSGFGKKVTEAIKGNPNNPLSLRNNTKRGMMNAALAGGATAQASMRKGMKEGGGYGRLRRRAATAAMWAAPDLDKYRKDQNELFDKEISGKVGIGADNIERAFFARQWTGPDTTLDNGQTLRTGRWYSTYRGSDGKYAEHSAGDVARGRRSYAGNESKIQTLIKYESGKVANDEDFYGVDINGNTIYDPSMLNKPADQGGIDRRRMPLGSFLGNLPQVMRESGLSQPSAAGASIGSFFQTQAQRKELKHTKLQPDWTWKQDDHAYVQDWAENMGSYAATTSKTSPIKRLTSLKRQQDAKLARITAGQPRMVEVNGVNVPETWTAADQRSQEDFVRIAQGLDQRLRSGAIGTITESGEPIAAGSGGPGRVNEAVREFVETVLPPQQTNGGGNGGGNGRPPSPGDWRGPLNPNEP